MTKRFEILVYLFLGLLWLGLLIGVLEKECSECQTSESPATVNSITK